MAILDNFLFVGDSFTALMQKNWDSKYGSNVQFYAEVGRNATELKNLLQKDKNLPLESSIDGVVLLIGINNILGKDKKINNTNKEDVIQCIKLLKSKYKSKKIYVQRVFPVCSKYDLTYDHGWQNVNAAVKSLNSSVKSYCDTINGVNYIDTTRGFSNNAVLVDSKTLDGLHINPIYYSEYIKNIADAVSNTTKDNQEDTSGYPSIIKKLLPDSLSGKSYETSGFDQKFIIIHNMGGGDNNTSYKF